jgi:outer membrane protein OmpA-like peptidoglycan-associated protein
MNQDYPDVKMSIAGHTDNSGKPEKNQALSVARAESVKKYLVSKGVAENRLTATGYGQDQPIADNTTPAGKAKNRRVEFKVSQ